MLAHTPLDTLDIEKDRTKYFWLFLRYGYLVVPFLFAGMAVAIALQQFAASVHRTYFWNLIGSGLGSFLFVLCMLRAADASESVYRRIAEHHRFRFARTKLHALLA